MSKQIPIEDIKVGDTITITRQVVVDKVHLVNLQRGQKAAIVTPKPDIPGEFPGTIAATRSETVTLDKRPKEKVIIPESAEVIAWEDEDNYRYGAHKVGPGQWAIFGEDIDETRSTTDLQDEINDEYGDFDTYREGSFTVIKRKPDFATGGYVHGLSIGHPSDTRTGHRSIIGNVGAP